MIGEAYTWGSGEHGCHPGDKNELLPRQVELFDSKFKLMTLQLLKNGTSVIFDFDGKIYSFGDGSSGSLGHGDLKSHVKPRMIEALSKETILQVAGSWGLTYDHQLFRNDTGDVFACGNNKHWQCLPFLNSDLTLDVLIPQKVPLPARMSSIACGFCYSGAVNASSE